MREDQKNLFIAMGLSLLVIIGWNFFYGVPEAQRQRQSQQQTQLPPQTTPPQASQPAPSTTAPGVVAPQGAIPGAPAPTLAPTTPSPAPVPVFGLTREQALQGAPRVRIDTPSLSGSINLRGGRIDDVRLTQFRETLQPGSATISLLNPAGSPSPYFVESGFVAQPGSNVVAPRPDTLWTADRQTLTADQPVTLTWDNGQGLIFRRIVSVDASYMFTIRNVVENTTDQPVTLFPYALTSRVGKPRTEGYIVLHEGFVGVVGDSRVQEYTYDNVEKEPKQTRLFKGTGGWVGITDKYWATAVIPEQNVAFEARFAAMGPPTARTYQSDFLEEGRTVAPGASIEATHRIFSGAKETLIIDGYQANLQIKNFDLMIDWGWFYFITKPLFWLIHYIYQFVGNFGVAILVVTVLIKLVFFPLASRSYVSMAKMKAVQPEMKALQERYVDDKQQLQKELMELYKREKINPIAGCLPIVVQIPVFFALYKVIFITIEMRHAPFFGWIQDLSGPDPTNLFNLFGLLPFNPTLIPVIGPFLWVGVWPILMGISMFVQMKMNPEPTDPIQKALFAWMPVIFTFMLGAFPAGLVIYWTWNNVLSLAQQYYIMRKQGVKIELWGNLAGLFRKKSATQS
ncbi:MAG: membrane protein insertase YidC [Beijerinckiaceae bacterium]|nr:membrane protein insertase YidC [Beijerinckiaceae bacterium]